LIDSFGQALLVFANVKVLLYLLAGVLLGLPVGVIPGLSGVVGIALLLPLVFGMETTTALVFLLSLGTVTFTGGAITAILLNIPGTDCNAATLIDGFPLSQKGQAARAVGAAIGASTFGAIITVPVALFIIPMIAPFVLKFRAPEIFFLILLGLTFTAVLSKGSMNRGLISAGLGLLLSFVGFQPLTGVPRFTFDTAYLYDGFRLVSFALGIFAFPELYQLAVERRTIAREGVAFTGIKEVFKGLKDVFIYKWTFLRSSLIGYIIGLVPGVGAITATFIAYGHAKTVSKHPEKFGKGSIEGVIAAESANNSVVSGALLTTMAFGIPGSAMMAILLGALMLLGLKPGPLFLVLHLDLAFAMLICIVIASFIGGVVCIFSAPLLAKVTALHPDYLFGISMPIIFLGAYIYDEIMLNVVVMLLLGIAGIFMKKFGFGRPAMFLGYVLGGLFEENFFRSIKTFGWAFPLTPICMILIFIIIFVLYHQYIVKLAVSCFRIFKQIKRITRKR